MLLQSVSKERFLYRKMIFQLSELIKLTQGKKVQMVNFAISGPMWKLEEELTCL